MRIKDLPETNKVSNLVVDSTTETQQINLDIFIQYCKNKKIPMGYLKNVSYNVGDITIYDNILYICIQNCINIPPSNLTFWKELAKNTKNGTQLLSGEIYKYSTNSVRITGVFSFTNLDSRNDVFAINQILEFDMIPAYYMMYVYYDNHTRNWTIDKFRARNIIIEAPMEQIPANTNFISLNIANEINFVVTKNGADVVYNTKGFCIGCARINNGLGLEVLGRLRIGEDAFNFNSYRNINNFYIVGAHIDMKKKFSDENPWGYDGLNPQYIMGGLWEVSMQHNDFVSFIRVD